MAKIMVTGVNGFVGQHLAKEISSEGHKVIGIGHNSELLAMDGGTVNEYFACDLTKAYEVANLPLDGIDAIINLAGLANVGDSFNNPDLYSRVNVAVLTSLCERLVRESRKTRMVAISTGAVYESDQPMPLTEDSRIINNGSPYALSKLLMEEAARKYRVEGLDCVIVRPFNHAGPGQRLGFLVPDLFKKIQTALNNKLPLRVGNLNTRRDYTDVRDVVRAYRQLALSRSLNHDIYNVCSGRSVAGTQILELLLRELGDPSLEIEVDKTLMRPRDPEALYGSNHRLQTEISWHPEITLDQTIKDFVAAAT